MSANIVGPPLYPPPLYLPVFIPHSDAHVGFIGVYLPSGTGVCLKGMFALLSSGLSPGAL